MLTPEQNKDFDIQTHLFATNDLTKLHNKKILKQLNVPIAQSLAKGLAQKTAKFFEDDQDILKFIMNKDKYHGQELDCNALVETVFRIGLTLNRLDSLILLEIIIE